MFGLSLDDQKMINQQTLLSLVVCKVMGDEFLGWMIMRGDLKLPSLLL